MPNKSCHYCNSPAAQRRVRINVMHAHTYSKPTEKQVVENLVHICPGCKKHFKDTSDGKMWKGGGFIPLLPLQTLWKKAQMKQQHKNQLKRELQRAVDDEKYEDAAHIKVKLDGLFKEQRNG